MAAAFAAPIARIVVGTRQQRAGTRRLNDRDGAIGPELRAFGVEWDKQVQTRHCVRIHGGKNRRMLGDVEISLVNPDLRCVVWIGLFDPITIEGTPTFVTEGLVLPQARILNVG